MTALERTSHAAQVVMLDTIYLQLLAMILVQMGTMEMKLPENASRVIRGALSAQDQQIINAMLVIQTTSTIQMPRFANKLSAEMDIVYPAMNHVTMETYQMEMDVLIDVK
eukprot:TRINITY_DN20449_c0_g1_i1.p2 TRINITY_DN20449_c0_g1~~TRINITY_DN20449_c0_g1_i1.p2  ORF type:complete len:110 (-),score=12.18 TRINITY_DN20449_c0_g1_i1:99-428(-)